MTKYYIILIEDDDNCDLLETKLNENDINYELEVIDNEPNLIYEFRINQMHKKFVQFICITHCIQILNIVNI